MCRAASFHICTSVPYMEVRLGRIAGFHQNRGSRIKADRWRGSSLNLSSYLWFNSNYLDSGEEMYRVSFFEAFSLPLRYGGYEYRNDIHESRILSDR